MIAPDDPRHGSYAGSIAGCKCARCREALSWYRKRMLHDVRNGRRRLVPVIGYRRRLQALQAIGWPVTLIAERLGEQATHVHYRARHSRQVSRRHHDALVAVYDELSMTPGPSARTRAYATRQGWPVPLAWDDNQIDNPDAQPHTGIQGKIRGQVKRVWAEDVEWLLDSKLLIDQIADRLGVKINTLEICLKRQGRMDLWERLSEAARHRRR